ncbi:MAG TPA: hypothetical protein VF126_08715 [Acidobacteriaceae bacterium]
MFSQSAFAGAITVAAPVNGSNVSSPVWVRAHNVGCNGQTPTVFGYSVDNGSTLVNGVTKYDIDTKASISAGTHTIHYKSWVGSGVCPVVSTTFTVAGSSTGSTSTSSSGSSTSSAVTITSPLNGASGLTSPIWVRTHTSGCNGKASTSFGYSFDSNSTFYAGKSTTDIDATGVSVGTGSHTIHFKTWVSGAICPVVNSTFNVGASSSSGGTSGGSSLPSSAVSYGLLDGKSGWAAEHDGGTPGSSKGSMVYPATTPSYDKAREFYMTYTNRGGERWHISFGNDPNATHFALDLYVYLVNPSQVANLELDLNQVDSNGHTIVYGTQCSSYSKTWEYVYVSSGSPHWKPSNIPCNPLTWTAKTWHHIQIGYHRTTSGTVVHDWVDLDGKHSTFSGASGYGALSLGWAKGSLVTNYQIDGEYKTSGSVTSYVHNMTYYHW